jgi:hypothetical protein
VDLIFSLSLEKEQKMPEIRKFVVCDGPSSDAKIIRNWAEYPCVYVAELVPSAGCRDYDEDHIEVSPASPDRIRTAIVDLVVPLFCCRGPHRKLPDAEPLERLRAIAAKGWEGLHPGIQVMLFDELVTL